eukprot:TRINITY_DN6877_c0_g2_i3.p1 TRINITY_DN6877_c0_g2~~TRINITY_DN6877_c0_g2_i3.p1  ORF type:complete len:331 (-),score=76.52 TRINITY_DN6877_c0_g2_i3:471-1406(-)
MCIIQGDEDYRVSNTQIFVAPTQEGRQFTVYSNHVGTKPEHDHSAPSGGSFLDHLFSFASPTSKSKKTVNTPGAATKAMILPVVSYAKGEDVQLIDLSHFKDMFDRLEKFFESMRPRKNSRFIEESEDDEEENSLEVVRVGSYDVSIVPTKEDFRLLRKDVFQLDPTVGKLFGDEYPENFAFIVCKLAESEEFHPFGYVSPRQKDSDKSNGSTMFVPTYHFHGKAKSTADWDHTIYIASQDGTPLMKNKSPIKGFGVQTVEKEAANTFLKEKINSELPTSIVFDWSSIKAISRCTVKKHSYHANHDVYVAG